MVPPIGQIMLKVSLPIVYCLNFMYIHSFLLFLDDCGEEEEEEAEKRLIDLLGSRRR